MDAVNTLIADFQAEGDRARYHGVRKNLFDLRRVAVVHNLHILMRQRAEPARAA